MTAFLPDFLGARADRTSSAIRSRLILLLAIVGAACSSASKDAVPVQPSSSGSPVALEGTYWRAVEVAGKPLAVARSAREPHLQLQNDRVSGSDGCNRLTGGFERRGEALTFAQVAGTRMACSDTAEVERAFNDALARASRFAIVGDRLTLFDAAGVPLAVFAAVQAP